MPFCVALKALPQSITDYQKDLNMSTVFSTIGLNKDYYKLKLIVQPSNHIQNT